MFATKSDPGLTRRLEVLRPLSPDNNDAGSPRTSVGGGTRVCDFSRFVYNVNTNDKLGES
jgi:hypothetical protein